MNTATKAKPRRWFVRTVRDGAITIEGITYRPVQIHRPYDGRLDGERMAFARYLSPWLPTGVEPFIALWGSRQDFRCDSTESHHEPHVVDGTLPWMFWDSRPDRLHS